MPRRTLAALVACAALVAVPHALPATAASTVEGGAESRLPAAKPPRGKAWLTGVIVDQAGRPRLDVNVEAWTTGAKPVVAASSRTYQSSRTGQNGFFNLEVPLHAKYRILVSATAGAEDKDPFKKLTYVASNGNTEITAGTRKERKLGRIEVAPQASQIRAKVTPAAVAVGSRARLLLSVTSAYVDLVLGDVSVTVGGKKVSGELTKRSKGRLTLQLPKLSKPGSYTVKVSYAGSPMAGKSTTTAKLKVKPKAKK